MTTTATATAIVEKKLDGWFSSLIALIDSKVREPLNPGHFDCALWANDCVAVQTGFDLASQWRGQYSTIEEGMALINASGYANLSAIFEANTDLFRKVNRSEFVNGDIAVLETEQGEGLGVVVNDVIYVVGLKGLGCAKTRRASYGFQIRTQHAELPSKED